MQPVVEPVRDHLTSAQVVGIIQDASAVKLRGGLEIIDRDLTVVEDISDSLAGGRVERQSYADLHGSAQFAIRRDVDWGGDLLRPYIVMSAGGLSARFNLGAYHPNTPARPGEEDDPTYDVQGYDILYGLRQKVGDAFGIAAGTNYLEAIESIITAQGFTRYVIDPQASSVVAPTSRAWAFDPEQTWLGIVNDLLGSIGYQGVYSDWDGQLRMHAYILPLERTPEWFYSDDQVSTMLTRRRSLEYDYFEAPNRWVVYRTNMADEAAPVAGNGIYTFTNQSVGLTSVDARRGLVQVKTEGRDAADQAALIAEAQKIIAADMEIPTVIPIETSINPLHWHFDRLYVYDTKGIPTADAMCTRWAIPLPPETGDMTQEWRVIA